MITRKKVHILALAVLAVVFVSLVFTDTTSAFSLREGVNAARGNGQPAELFGNTGIITALTNTLLFVAGTLSVIMVIVGGLRYVVSGGNSTSVTAAKNTILYAIVGLIIAMLAFAAINFVLTTIAPGSNAGYTNV